MIERRLRDVGDYSDPEEVVAEIRKTLNHLEDNGMSDLVEHMKENIWIDVENHTLCYRGDKRWKT